MERTQISAALARILTNLVDNAQNTRTFACGPKHDPSTGCKLKFTSQGLLGRALAGRGLLKECELGFDDKHCYTVFSISPVRQDLWLWRPDLRDTWEITIVTV